LKILRLKRTFSTRHTIEPTPHTPSPAADSHNGVYVLDAINQANARTQATPGVEAVHHTVDVTNAGEPFFGEDVGKS
jgi:hypothetical protein